MNLSELNELDLGNIGNWPLPVRGLAVLLVCALLAAAAYWFDIRKQGDEYQRLVKQEQTLKTKLRVKAAQAANLDAYLKQIEEMRAIFAQMRQQLPSRTEVPELLVDISQTGVAAGLEFELFKPLPEQRKDFYAEKPIDIVVTGGYHQFGTFVSGVAALPRIVTLHDISIEPEGKDGELVMSTTARTYRYLDEEEIAEQEAKAREAKSKKKKKRKKRRRK